MKDIRLIAMDMDGTLLDETQTIPQENLEALRAAEARGVKIAICSGRSAADVSYFASDAGMANCTILSLNGACCLPAPHAAPYALSTLADTTADQVIEVLLRHPITFAAFQAERVVVIQNNQHVQKLNWGTHVARGNVNAYAYGVEALRKYQPEGICKFVYIDEENAPRLDVVRQELRSIEGLVVTSSWTNNLELMPVGVNKGIALRNLAKRLGLEREQVMAMGDYDNDLDMIEYAGLGVAMGNGSERVKSAAQFIAKTNDEFGVAQAIHQFVLTP